MIISLFMEEAPLCGAPHDGSAGTDEPSVRREKRGQAEREREPDAVDHERGT
jgi:hypothetical protein